MSDKGDGSGNLLEENKDANENSTEISESNSQLSEEDESPARNLTETHKSDKTPTSYASTGKDCDGGAQVVGEPCAPKTIKPESLKTEEVEKLNTEVNLVKPKNENLSSGTEPVNKLVSFVESSSFDKQDIQSLLVKLPPIEGATASDPGESLSNACSSQGFYHIKWINFNSQKLPIITQNENGPCPLLAIMNVLLLKERIKFAPMMELITADQVMTYLGDCILENAPKPDITEMAQLNYEQNMHDAMTIIHRLQTGLDVNVKFTGVKDFEYTSECIIFDLLAISLYHGWLVDPQNAAEVAAVGTGSYNQLVEKIISQKNSDKPELVTEALVAEGFLERTASQLTYHGLCELSNTSMKEKELCVFFRNNHFCTMYSNNNELFLLVTDQGFLTESNVVWETLSNVEGDCHFVDSNFRTYTKPEIPPQSIQAASVEITSEEQIDHDYLLAMSLLQEQQQVPDEEIAWSQMKNEQQQLQVSDHELAIRMQEEENIQAQAVQQQQQQQQQQQRQQAPSTSRSTTRPREQEKEKDKFCHIL